MNNLIKSGDYESDPDATIANEFDAYCYNTSINSDEVLILNNRNDCSSVNKSVVVDKVQQRPQFSISSPDRKRGLTSIIDNLRTQKQYKKDTSLHNGDLFSLYGDTNSTTEPAEPRNANMSLTKSRKRRLERTSFANNNNINGTMSSLSTDYLLLHGNNNNNNNNLKNERLSPSTPDTSSRSRSVTPSSASHPDTPPAADNPMLAITGRNYSDIMRSLAAKYNNTNPNDYFGTRNGFPPPMDPRYKPFPTLLPTTLPPQTKDDASTTTKKPDFAAMMMNQMTQQQQQHPATPMFPPLIDMSSTQTLLAMVRTAKEAELQSLLKSIKKTDASSPLDLSAGAPPLKKLRTAKSVTTTATTTATPPSMVTQPMMGSSSLCVAPTSTGKRDQPESPRLLQDDVANWSVDDVCSFVGGIDICAEYVQNFRDQRIDGAGLPLLTEEHLTTKMNMKLGPALKLRSILAKRIGSCSVCLHCTHCHTNNNGHNNNNNNNATITNSPAASPNNNSNINATDSGGNSNSSS